MVKSKSKKSKALPGPRLVKPKAVNPFMIQHSKKKFDILGVSKKGTTGNLGISRQRAQDIRKSTLLVEYKNRNKNNVFLDRRLGEKDKTLTDDQKMDIRRVEEIRKTKRSMYNLSEQPDHELTHGGRPLTEDNMNVPISDDELDEDGMLDAQFVKDQHFGGLPVARSSGGAGPPDLEDPETKYKTQMDRVEEIIVESKRRKLASRQERELQHSLVAELDSKLSDFLKINSKHKMTSDDRIKVKESDPMPDYNRLLRTLEFEGSRRALPTERLKSEEEIVKEEKERLAALEADRLERMKPDYLQQQPKVTVHKSADSLDVGFIKMFDTKTAALHYNKDGKLVLPKHEEPVEGRVLGEVHARLSKDEKKRQRKQAKLEKRLQEEDDKLMAEIGEESDEEEDADITQEKGSDEDADNSLGEDEESDDEDEDNYSDIVDDEDEDDEDLEDIEDDEELEDEEISSRKGSSKSSSGGATKASRKRVSFQLSPAVPVDEATQQRQMEDAAKELPYTFEIPSHFDGFWELLQKRSPEEVSTLLGRMIASNHPKLQHANLRKCSVLFSYLLQTVHVLCDAESSASPCPGQYGPQAYLEVLPPHIYSLMTFSPEEAGKAMLLVFIEKRDEYRNKVKKRYPTLDTIAFLQIAGLLFPVSDFYHPVLTPVKTFMTQLLGQAKMTNARGVLAGLHVAALLHEYIRESGRYCSELVLRLQGLLLRCVPADLLQEHLDREKRLINEDNRETQEQQQQTQQQKEEKLKTHQQQEQLTQQQQKRRKRDTEYEKIERSIFPLEWLWSPVLPSFDMLPLRTKIRITAPPAAFNLAMINDDQLEMSDSLRCRVLLVTLQLLKDLCRDWAKLPTIRTIMSPLHTLLWLLPVHLYPDQVVTLRDELQAALDTLPPHPPRMKLDKGRPKPLRMLEPMIVEVAVNAPRSSFNKTKEQNMQKKLEHCIKRERKAARREIVKDNKFIAKHKLVETLKSDAERIRKVNLIMNELGHQESEHNKYEKMKPGQR